MMDTTIIGFLVGVLIVGGILIIVIMTTKSGPRPLNTTAYRSRWLKIEQSLSRSEASYQLSVLHADKLLDQALKDRGTKGESMGERMKVCNATWSNANAVWTAHKLRNRIAHEPDAGVSYEEARQALSGFKRALKDLRAI